ncbi:MAG TPA: hypothetical protein VMW58_15230 [Anaerolineae bacterium]|nr:hypothetical protein [Anaerolineae bacterium]
MSGNIYLIRGNDELVEMSEQPYDSEDLLQQLLARYPDLLAGDQMDVVAPRRWLLVSREAPLPSEDDGAGRWSVDHLFLDQDGIPTLVEVKRSSDTRIRREVVGQMLDYAANALAYWPEETIRARFEARCESQGLDPARKVSELKEVQTGEEVDVEAFWSQVKINLQAGRVRLVFVADEIPQELKRIVEFLNIQMDPAEVLAVEIKQYVSDKSRTLVPRVIGQRSKSVSIKRKWDETSFLQALEARCSPEDADIARRILAWARDKELRIRWGGGSRDGSFFPMVDHLGTANTLIAVWTYGRVELQFQHMMGRAPFDDESKRVELLRLVSQIPGVSLREDVVSLRPALDLSVLNEAASMELFTHALDWAVDQIMSTQPESPGADGAI